MKVVACEKCGAKYQIDDNETVDNYECSVCAGNLKEVEEYPSTYSSINQNYGNNLYKSSYNPNSQVVYCEKCGLKHTIDKNEYPEDYECSSCFGNLRYVDEDLNKDLEKRLKLRQKQRNSKSKINSNSRIDSKTKSDSNKTYTANKTSEEIKEEKLREEIKNEFYENLDIDKEIDELNNHTSTNKEIDKFINNDNKKQELVPYPNMKNTSYHDVYIVAGLILALIGFADILLSQRIYSVIFIAIGFILFGIGIFKNKNYTATEKRGRIIREKLLSLPEKFYVLYFVKVPDANDGINHVVVGASGIFSIVSQSYNEKEDKEKPRTDHENINLVNKSKLDNLDILGISDIVEAANNNYENNKRREEEARAKMEEMEYKKQKVGKFKFRETPLKFDHNNKIKQKSIHLSERLIDFLNENGLSNCYVEPLVGFVNNDVAIINMPLTDEDLFLDELLYKIVHGRRQLDDTTTHKVAVLLSQYSTECSS